MLGINMNKLDGGVMDIQKEFEAVAASLPAFQMYFKIKGVATTELFRKRADGEYAYGDVRICFEIWKAAKANAVPEGYVLVPKDPTLLMQRAGSAEAIKPNLGIASMRDIYKAMIEAQEPAND